MTNAIRFLDWDSHFFGRKIGKLELDAGQQIAPLLIRANEQHYQLLYLYTPVAIEEKALHGFKIVDVGGHVHFEKELTDNPINRGFAGAIVRHRTTELSEEVLEIGYLSGRLSRFKTDPLIPSGWFQELYRTWLAKTLGDQEASALYTYQERGRPAALISTKCHLEVCTIGLLAVLPTYRGRGIATQLLKHVEAVSSATGAKCIKVITQLTNAEAQSLYRKNGYNEVERSLLYHVHVDKTQESV